MSEFISLSDSPRWRDYAQKRSERISEVFGLSSLSEKLSSKLELLTIDEVSKAEAISNRDPEDPLQKQIPSRGQKWVRHPDRYGEGVELLVQKVLDHQSAYAFLLASHLREGDGVLSGLRHEILGQKVFLKVDLLKDGVGKAARAFRLSRVRRTDGLVSGQNRLEDAIARPSAILFDSFDGEILSLIELSHTQ